MKKKKLPEKVDLRDKFGPVVDQGEFGSSSACATTKLFSENELNWLMAVDYLVRNPEQSKLFMYYSKKDLQNDKNKIIR